MYMLSIREAYTSGETMISRTGMVTGQIKDELMVRNNPL